ncbi:MAG: kelch repeat-containing protein [Thermodesulfobacteriota bacterium]|nr:kelch repeat-containing protein [Thermodesulfobacteriota bacterium]
MRLKRFGFMVGIALVVALLFTPNSFAEVSLEWAPMENMNEARTSLATCILDGKIYALGGHRGYGGYLGTAEVYDPATDQWSDLPHMNVKRTYGTAQSFNGKVYIFGGKPSGQTGTPLVEEYDPTTDSWNYKASLPFRRHMAASVLLDGEIYVIGGSTYGGDGYSKGRIDCVDVYNPVSDCWRSETYLPEPRTAHEAVVLNGKIYVIGGSVASGSYSADVRVFDPLTHTWTPGPALQTRRQSFGCALLNGKIYVFGGYNETDGKMDSIEVFDPSIGYWQYANSSLSAPREQLEALALNDSIYLVGGASESELWIPLVEKGTMVQRSEIEIVNCFPAPKPMPFGLAWDGSHLWLSDLSEPGTVTDSIFEMTTDGTVVHEYFHPNQVLGDPRGLAWDETGPYLWMCSAGSHIFKMDPLNNLNLLDYFGPPRGNTTGLAWDGDYVWATQPELSEVYSFDGTGQIGSIITLPNTVPVGLAFDGQDLYVADHLNSQIIRLSRQGEVLDIAPWPEEVYRLRDMAFDGEYFWIVVNDDRSHGRVCQFSFIGPNTVPIAVAGPDQTVEQESHEGTEVTLDGSASTDPDSTPGTNDDIVSFDWYEGDTFLGTGEVITHTFPLGAHVVTLVVTDSEGEPDDDEVIITVQDTTPPEVSVSIAKDSLWPPSHGMVDVGLSLEVSDICDAEPVVSIEVTSDEPTATAPGAGGAKHAPDAEITDDGVMLRAERSGNGDGRVYVITVTATDVSGNTASDSASVKVNHNKKKEAVNSGQNYDATDIN